MLLVQWYVAIAVLALGPLALVLAALAPNSASVDVQAPWKSTPFVLNLVESGEESGYLLLLSRIVGFDYDDLSDVEVEDDNVDEEDPEITHLSLYNAATRGLTPYQKSIFTFNVVNKVFSPRIQSHYDYYENVLLPEYSKKLEKACSSDSFGNDYSAGITSWVLFNDKIYCSSDALYAIQTDKKAEHEQTLAFDRVIGSNEDAPLLILYGDGISQLFKDMFAYLYQTAEADQIRFVWRYLPVADDSETLSGYGVDLTFKNLTQTSDKIPKLTLPKDLQQISELSRAFPYPEDAHLGIKLTSFLINKGGPQKYELFKQIINNFPKYAHFLSKSISEKLMELTKYGVEENEKLGASDQSYGIYVNGAVIPKLKFDLYSLVNSIKEEYSYISAMVLYGFNIPQAKRLISKFALLSAVKEQQFKNGNENRFSLYKHQFVPKQEDRGGVVFFNDIMQDPNYELYSSDRKEMYLGSGSHQMPRGQIPPLRENIHDLIFAINLSSKEQLRVFFHMAKFFLDRSIPKQIGLLPLVGEDPKDELIAQKVYFLAENGSPKESLAILYQYFEADSPEKEDEVLNSIPVDQTFAEHHFTASSFSIEIPSIIVNGVIHSLRSSTWQADMKTQVFQDVKLLQRHIHEGVDDSTSLKSIIYSTAKEERNLRIVPDNPSTIRYKRITQEMYDHSVEFTKKGNKDMHTGVFWLIGDFNTAIIQDQFLDLIRLLTTSSNTLQIRVLSTTKSSLLQQLSESYSDKSINSRILREIKKELVIGKDNKVNQDVIKALESSQIQTHRPSMLFNSRYFRLDRTFKEKELNQLVTYEYDQRMSIISEVVNAYPNEYDDHSFLELKPENYDNIQWFDLVVSLITKSFHIDDVLYIEDASRFDFSSLNTKNSIDISPYDREREVDILLIVDPISEFTQQLLSTINSVKDFSFVNIRILLQPQSESSDVPIRRFYKGNFPSSKLEFDNDGAVVEHSAIVFDKLPDLKYQVQVIPPNKWIVTSNKTTPSTTDVDNVILTKEGVSATYQLKSVLVEGYANDVKFGSPSTGLELELSKQDTVVDTIVMSFLGYFQLQADFGLWKLRIKDDSKSSRHCSLLSADANKYNSNDIPIKNSLVPVFSLEGVDLNIRITKNPGYENKNLLTDTEDVEQKSQQADINIFTIASGKLYERLVSIMMLSARKNTKKLIKFWIIENFVSPEFRTSIQLLSEEYKFDYQFISYKWPLWLRTQRDKERTIWGYKILFLDLIFPQDLEKVIFVDADLIVRSDLLELLDIDLQGAPYGFTPMCDSREDMEGFRFWKDGYWKTVLQDEFKYHISALFVVDLKKFRSIAAGERLRAHYQKLSVDPNSLSNLDQDLPNNMQKWIKIHSLPQEWLWCETWCSKDTFKSAKVVDLCNNPQTKESKVERGKREIAEWSRYDDEISSLLSRKEAPYLHDEL